MKPGNAKKRSLNHAVRMFSVLLILLLTIELVFVFLLLIPFLTNTA